MSQVFDPQLNNVNLTLAKTNQLRETKHNCRNETNRTQLFAKCDLESGLQQQLSRVITLFNTYNTAKKVSISLLNFIN